MKATLDASPDLKEVASVIKGLKRVELCVIVSREGEEYGQRSLYCIAWYDLEAGEATVLVGTEPDLTGDPKKEDQLAFNIVSRKTSGRWKNTKIPIFTSMEKAKKSAVSAKNAILKARKANEGLQQRAFAPPKRPS